MGVLYRFTIDGIHEVARCDPGLRGRPRRVDVGNENARRLRQLQAVSNFRQDGLELNSQPAPRHRAIFLELFSDEFRLVRRDRERDSY